MKQPTIDMPRAVELMRLDDEWHPWLDNHTATGINGPISDTQRYKMCGNGVASPVAAWLGKHILNV